ncbi:hypothetical protein K439DRAFT_1664453 [Ramaria rubella]|nr:hypothetical protein K439DRAFT_1664453 [Ramaria rubella]
MSNDHPMRETRAARRKRCLEEMQTAEAQPSTRTVLAPKTRQSRGVMQPTSSPNQPARETQAKRRCTLESRKYTQTQRVEEEKHPPAQTREADSEPQFDYAWITKWANETAEAITRGTSPLPRDPSPSRDMSSDSDSGSEETDTDSGSYSDSDAESSLYSSDMSNAEVEAQFQHLLLLHMAYTDNVEAHCTLGLSHQVYKLRQEQQRLRDSQRYERKMKKMEEEQRRISAEHAILMKTEQQRFEQELRKINQARLQVGLRASLQR